MNTALITIRSQILLAGTLLVLSLPNAFAQSDFSAFWKQFKTAVIAGDKAKVAEMTKFPMSFYGSKIGDRAAFLGKYGKIFNGEANAGQCFGGAEAQKDSATMYSVYCPFKKTPNDKENAPIRFVFELTKTGWKFTALDNINE